MGNDDAGGGLQGQGVADCRDVELRCHHLAVAEVEMQRALEEKEKKEYDRDGKKKKAIPHFLRANTVATLSFRCGEPLPHATAVVRYHSHMTVICRSHNTSGDVHTGINNAFLTVSHDDRGDVHPSHGGHLQEVIHSIGGEVELHHRELEGWGGE